MALDVRVDRINRLEDKTKKIRGFADIVVNDSLLIKGLQIFEGKNGLFVSMPRLKAKDNKYYETVRALTPQLKEQIESQVLWAYGGGDHS